jgi:Tfp pilus tip-associated adhesin PilY1
MITGNGYDSTNKTTSLMVIDLKTGAMLYEVDTGTASNGLSSPAVLDVDGDKVADYVYAGDQSGNVWRFKLQTSSDHHHFGQQILYRAGQSAHCGCAGDLCHPGWWLHGLCRYRPHAVRKHQL